MTADDRRRCALLLTAAVACSRGDGYRGTYPQLSRIVLAPRTQRQPFERTA